MRALLRDRGYRPGAVTIDASDWYIAQRMAQRLEENPKADLKPYRDFYLKHIWERTSYYDRLARELTGRDIKHTLLIHHNLLNALFLSDLIGMYRAKGWNVIGADEAFRDPIFKQVPVTMPAGESLVWAYPGEDGPYEKDEMDQLGL